MQFDAGQNVVYVETFSCHLLRLGIALRRGLQHTDDDANVGATGSANVVERSAKLAGDKQPDGKRFVAGDAHGRRLPPLARMGGQVSV